MTSPLFSSVSMETGAKYGWNWFCACAERVLRMRNGKHYSQNIIHGGAGLIPPILVYGGPFLSPSFFLRQGKGVFCGYKVITGPF